MNWRQQALGVVLIGGTLVPASRAAEEPRPVNVRVDVQMVSVPVAASLKLLPMLRDDKSVESGWKELQEMLGNGQATLIDWPVLWLRSALVERSAPRAGGAMPDPPRAGHGRGVSENVEEKRYPSEFDPPQAPQTFGTIPETKKAVRPSWEQFIPNAFETRNTGPSVETAAWVEDAGRTILLSLNAQHIRLDRFTQSPKPAAPIGISGLLVEPVFVSLRVMTLLRVRDDHPVLVNVAVLQNPEPHVELFILRAKVQFLPREAETALLPETSDPFGFDPHRSLTTDPPAAGSPAK